MSIRLQLALWHSAFLAVTLLVFSVTLYLLVEQHLNRTVDDAIDSRVAHLSSEMAANNPNGMSGNPLNLPSLDNFESPEIYVQVRTVEGSLLASSSNLGGKTLPGLERLPAVEEFPDSLDGIPLKVTVAPIVINGQTVAWLQLGASFQQRDRVLNRLRWMLISGAAGAVAIAGLLGSLLAGRALRPVSEMTETAQAIALSRGFSRRLNVDRPKDELGQLAQTFNEMLSSLEEAYSSQQRFTADASHELRAPLTAIRGNLDLLDRIKDMPDAERRQTLKTVRREVERLSRLVNDLLSLARADAGQGLDLGPVELDALLVEVHREARIISNGVNVRLSHLEPAVVVGDDDRLRELLFILVDNAIRYTPAGETVILWLKREHPWVTVGVEDTGIGIRSEDLPRIFDRFWRADQARSRDRGGTGLGLAIGKWIVDQHGGEILVDSTPGKGTIFTVRLPAGNLELMCSPNP